MATSSIDTTSIVGRYLTRQTTGTRLNTDGNTADENQAVLESIAIAFQLNPRAVLSIVLNAANTLQQLINVDISLIDYVTAAIGETQNSDASPSSTAHLVDAQTALLDLDHIGRVDVSLAAFSRYQASINKFLDNELGPLLKKSMTGDFNRSGLEAKQDLFNSAGFFTQTHALVISRLKTLADAIDDFNSVDLSVITHAQTLSRVRSSLQQIKAGMDAGTMSNTVAALELLAGSSALQSISGIRGVYDDTIPLSQGLLLGPEPTSAFMESAVAVALSTSATYPHSTTLGVDGGALQSFEIPYTGKSGCPFVCNNLSQATFDIPAGYSLFVGITPGPAPDSSGVTRYEIALTSGTARTLSQVLADINTGFSINPGPLATDFATAGNSAIIILGQNSDTSVTVFASGTGSFDRTTGVFTQPATSAHAILSFSPNQKSQPVDSFDLAFLQRFFAANYGSTGIAVTQTADGRLKIESGSMDPLKSQLQLASPATVMGDFGFASAAATPLAMQITDSTGNVQDPTTLGVLPGSVVHSGTFIEPVDSIDGNRLLFLSGVPLANVAVRVVAPVVVAAQALMGILAQFAGALDGDLEPLQGLLAPFLSTPTLAQVNTALAAFSTIRARLTSSAATGLLDRLSTVVIAESQEPDDAIAQSALKTLEERGMDQAQELLSQCQFSQFFALTSETSSKSTRFMKAMEDLVTKNLSTTTVEEDMLDNTAVSSSPTNVLTRKEVP